MLCAYVHTAMMVCSMEQLLSTTLLVFHETCVCRLCMHEACSKCMDAVCMLPTCSCPCNQEYSANRLVQLYKVSNCFKAAVLSCNSTQQCIAKYSCWRWRCKCVVNLVPVSKGLGVHDWTLPASSCNVSSKLGDNAAA
jgi:hypothetical protein